MEGNTILNPNPLVKFLNKPQKEFTKADIIRYVTKNDIEMINWVIGTGCSSTKRCTQSL